MPAKQDAPRGFACRESDPARGQILAAVAIDIEFVKRYLFTGRPDPPACTK